MLAKEYLSDEISTHTLTWSVTITCNALVLAFLISTHTLTWSVTVQLCVICVYTFISTHTLTWSVTLFWKDDDD